MMPPSPLAQFSILPTLPHKCASLKNVSINWYNREAADQHFGTGRVILPTYPDPVSTFGPSLSVFVQGLLHVETLLLPCVTLPALRHLAGLSTLRSLHVTEFPLELASSPFDLSFTTLTKLTMYNFSIASGANFLRMCVDTELESFAVVDFVAGPPPARILESFLDALTQCTAAHSRLSYLHLDLSGLEGTPVTAGTSRKLFCFPNLTTLHLKSNFGFDLDDAAILEMARAWPNLETLELPEQVVSPSSRLSLECLRILVQHSPRLRTLHLTFDASSIVPAPGCGTQDPVSQLLLASFDVAHSAITTPLSVARFISAIFPNLRRITMAREYYDNDTDDGGDGVENHAEAISFHARWKEVQAQIPVLLDIREEGKLWGRQK